MRFKLICKAAVVRLLILAAALTPVGACRIALAGEPLAGWKEVRRLAAPEATQAAAADERFVYAIANKLVAKYDRETGKLLRRSTGDATHLNTGYFVNGQMYCAHSNFPAKPEHSEIKMLDPETMVLKTVKDFGASDGSLTWAVRANGCWWCNFAFYGKENIRTYLVKYDNWREIARWTYPAEVIKAFGENSASCGIWQDGQLLVTGHDEREIFILALPEEGQTLRHLATVPAPFTGQGFAADPKTGGLIGIDRQQGRSCLPRGAGSEQRGGSRAWRLPRGQAV